MATADEPVPDHLDCPVAETLDLLSRRHTLRILHLLSEQTPLRFSEIEKGLGLVPKTLSARLEELTEEGLIERRAYAEVPPRVEYDLTEKGRALLPIFETIEAWQDEYGGE